MSVLKKGMPYLADVKERSYLFSLDIIYRREEFIHERSMRLNVQTLKTVVVWGESLADAVANIAAELAKHNLTLVAFIGGDFVEYKNENIEIKNNVVHIKSGKSGKIGFNDSEEGLMTHTKNGIDIPYAK